MKKCMLPQYLIEPKLSKHISWLWINYKSPEMSQQNPCFSPLRPAARCQTRICQYHLSCGRYHSFILTYVFREHFPALLPRSQFQGFSLCLSLTRFETNPKIIQQSQNPNGHSSSWSDYGGSIPIFKRDSSSNLFAPRWLQLPAED
jgi:hypothetical protein